MFLAIQSQSPQSFEFMLEMLADFPDYCISKMILKSLFLTFTHPSDSVLTFFDNNIFMPPQMQIEQFIPWEDGDMEEFIFPSHTSIISTELIVEKMQEQGMDVG